jgi:lysophospholipase L1-like esterase
VRGLLAIATLAACGAGADTQRSQYALEPGGFVPPREWRVLGDSTVMDLSSPSGGWGTQLGLDWKGYGVTNVAIPGSTIIDGGPGFPTEMDQWLSVKSSDARGLLIAGGFNELKRDYYTGEDIFGHMLLIADDAVDAGWTVVFASVLPCGGNCTQGEDEKRDVITALQRDWSAAHAVPYLDFDDSPVNCGDLYANGVDALCTWARYGGTDVIHPSPEAQRVLGMWAADRLAAPELLDP